MKVILVNKGKKSKAKEMDSLPEKSLRNVWTDSGCTCYMDEESLPELGAIPAIVENQE